MKTNELLEKYPKVTELIKNWHLDKLKLSLNSPEIDEEFKKQIKIDTITNEVISRVIDSNPHAYFEMFDEKKVYIEVLICEENEKVYFKSFVEKLDNQRHLLVESFNKRIQAERFGLEKAFKILEKKL